MVKIFAAAGPPPLGAPRWRHFPLVEAALFQAGWFACVLGAAHQLFWLGPVVAGAVLLIHLACMHQPRSELRVAGFALMTGVLADSLLGQLGLLRCAPFADAVSPPWMAVLWPLFGISLRTYIRWLQRRLVLAALLGAIAGPLSYWAGVRIGVLQLPAGTLTGLAAISVEWLIATPLLAWFAGWAGRPDAAATAEVSRA
ncbi:MAG: DUF2878 domain-containing protein [Planctomycetes bacterium]|nr:DUF2878 domain-containing protein [Planctomycetota bacterium]